jgi:hypothetical protein
MVVSARLSSADFERLRISVRQLPLAKVAQHVLEPLQQIVAAGLQRALQHHRIGQREIGRAHRIDECASGKPQPLALLVVQAVEHIDAAEHPVGDQQVTLPDHVEQRVLPPLRSVEALVLIGFGLHRPVGRLAAERALPEVEPLCP